MTVCGASRSLAPGSGTPLKGNATVGKLPAAALLLLAAFAGRAGAQVTYIGTSESASPADVSILLWTPGDQPGGKVKLVVAHITPETSYDPGGLPGYNEPKRAIQSQQAAVVTPGRYVIVAYCVYTLRDIRKVARLDAVAGSTYVVSCEGSTIRKANLVVRKSPG